MLHTEYIKDLVVPHPDKLAGSTYENLDSLEAVIDPEGIQEILEGENCDLDEFEAEVLATADYICSVVRDSLIYPEKSADHDDFAKYGVKAPVDLAALPEKQVADCFGFVIVASETLDEAGIDHWVGFINGHSVILLPSEEGKKLHLVDPLSPELTQDLQFSMVSGATVNDDMIKHGRSAIELNTLTIAARAKGSNDSLISEHPWLTFRPNQNTANLNQYAEQFAGNIDELRAPSAVPPARRGFLSIFKSTDGRAMLKTYNKFELAYLKGDYSDAASALSGLSGCFPDVDARRKHPEIKKVVAELAKNGSVLWARQILKGFFDSFTLISEDSRFPETHGDLLRVIAREGSDPLSAHEAQQQYEKALRYPRAYHDAIKAKLGKTATLIARLESND